jgi:hypothetical protein
MKSNLDKFFKTDKGLEKSGVWLTISDEVGFLVKPFRPENPAMKQAMATHFKPVARQMELGTLDVEKEREIMVKLFVQVSLVDWKGVEIEGKITPFSKDVAVPFLTGLPDLYKTLMEHAQDFRNYQEEGDESHPEFKVDVGNSSSTT